MTSTGPIPGPPSIANPGEFPGGPRPGGGRLVALALGAGLVAGVASWLIGEAALETFRPAQVPTVIMGQNVLRVDFHDRSRADRNNALLAYGALGSAMGLALGAAGGLARGSVRSAGSAAAFGAIAGAGASVAAAALALPFYFRALDVAPEELSRDVVLPLLVHLGAWSAAGLAGGLALGIGLGTAGRAGTARAARTAAGGMVGAAIGTVLFELLGSLAFPEAKTGAPISGSWATRLIARLAVAALASLVAAAVAEGTRRTPDPAPKPGPTGG